MNDATRPTGGAIRVGDFVVDPSSGELRGEAGKQSLSAQPLQVLLALAERPGGVVTRDELRARLWPADTYVDFEHGLNAIVKRLRDALGDPADAPRYIETVPRRGYRLIANVNRADEGAIPDAAPSPATLAARARRRIPPFVMFAALAVLAVGSALFVFRPWRSVEAAIEAPSPKPTVAPKRLTFGPGLQTEAAWSPDGRRIAYAADGNGNFDLFTLSRDGGEPVRVSSSPANETQPAWSPDGLRLVFCSDEDGGGLFTVGSEGGAVRRIAGPAHQPTWMPDGRDIAFARPGLQQIYLVRADGGEPPREILVGALTNGAWGSFAVHPDGRIGLVGTHSQWGAGFYVSDHEHRSLRSVTGGPQFPLAFPREPIWRVVWNRRGDAVFVEGNAEGVPTIWRVPVNLATQVWQRPTRVTTGTGGAERAAISPDGATLAFTSVVATTRYWVFPFEADRASPPSDGRPVTDEDASVFGLSVTADGKAIFYQEIRPGRRNGRGVRTILDSGETTVLVDNATPVPAPSGSGTAYGLFRTPETEPVSAMEFALAWRDGSGRERLLSPWGVGALLPSDVRPDNLAVLASWMRRSFTGPAALVEWPIGAGTVAAPRRVLLESKDKQFRQGRYSPDGRLVSFVASGLDGLTGQGRLELGIARAAGSAAAAWTRVAADHFRPDKPRWSPDGRTLYFLSRGAGGLFELWGVRIDPDRGVAAGEPFQITHFDSPRWHIDPRDWSAQPGIAKGRLVLPMQTVKGSVWLLSTVGT
jgi:Tol biopolymer transport system component/DNA-binding winged helix-turn-helix (wHTH) protein